ncbi:hypothetical protein JX265_004794 [Neoarthrinium moseri]|uniref:Uncharacterized protein n=1 Tax=Neoarthrinium moseri TaxID=1658444 RepID=A0A9Q0AS18_9PEZI|nr:hypothetical protein JX265_004794 [Neoarthrinium moseri]
MPHHISTSSKHSSSKSSSKSSHGKSHKSSSSHTASPNITEQWMQHQAVEGPWDGVNEVVGGWSTTGEYGEYAYAGSMAATQGSTKHKSHKSSHHHKSSGKK